MLLIRIGGEMPDIDTMGFWLFTIITAVFVAYHAMRYTAMKRYAREEAIVRAERERKQQERKAREAS
jgi:hypothetical protein